MYYVTETQPFRFYLHLYSHFIHNKQKRGKPEVIHVYEWKLIRFIVTLELDIRQKCLYHVQLH